MYTGGYGQPPLTLVVDGECCLDRLYGGFFSDWVCGGQWNRMVQFLAVLIQTVQSNNIELAVFFNGALEQQRLNEWSRSQIALRRNVNSVLKHVTVKGTPPPKVWWVAPVGLRTCLRMALRHLNIQVLCTMDDHHQEVIAFCRENNYHGLMAEDAEYIIFDPPRYFSSHQLKLTYKGSLETKEFILDEVARGLGLQRNYFCLLAALLGNYLLTESDLRDFYAALVPNYDRQQTPQEEVIRAVVKFIVNRCDVNNLLSVGAQIFGSISDPRVAKFKESVQYFLNGTKDGFLRYKPFQSGRRDGGHRQSPHQSVPKQEVHDSKHSSSPSESQQEPGPQIDPNPLPLPPVPHEVMRTASERHQKGLMCPWVYQVLTQGEVKFGVCMEDENSRELPNAVLFYRPVRQFVYAILFNLHHHTFMARKAKEEGQKGLATEVPEIKVREWVYTKNNPYRTADIVEATPINWAVPTVQRLWFGSVVDDKKRRLRAFLSCMRSDSPLMLHTSHVPQHLLIMATVLRYIMSNPTGPVLRKQELDAFLVTAFSPDLTNAHYLQDLQLPLVTARGAQLAALFMRGVETALFANDACGAPVPWLMCCPWLYFDGKLFHAKLIRANCARSLVEVCDGEIDLVAKVERCRQAILEGIRVEFAHPLLPPMPGAGGHKVGPPPPYPMAHPPGRGRGRGGPVRNSVQGGGVGRMFSRGGQLQVAGVVVGSWGPNYGSSSNDYRPRGTRYPHNGGGNMQGRSEPSRFSRTTRGRPTVLAKRRTIKKREIRSSRGRGMSMEAPGNSRTVGMKELLTTPGGGYSSQSSPVGPDGDGLSPNPPYTPQSHTSSGLKSPDSGVNVSILE
ncbi:constitutive coactivator of PPAR-gamma-like protein 1 isoform X2 [Penaeus japonicus]|uniref:constitutive coactivator of PPAR-gamma-like protein 1 isoform X2 n=1 Tax=Penaeus japonicus TaxID=27405 RepID=UPI001C70B217|nr:constitutive coactivator of PPAR-gamma-like protein 1 isoform X2 [Penaeus japonicus]XP_042883583.1 constitutive coactivator of PPAR-gamma-like protein 1 isoform X2 [Penaeus japonicus]